MAKTLLKTLNKNALILKIRIGNKSQKLVNGRFY